MANWFKLFETDLDESRMRYAITKLPEVWPVWTAVLMECCKHRSDTFSWGDNEHELFGFSDRLKISIPKVNAAIGILCEINYCKREQNSLKVLKWSDKQDDYLVRKARGDYDKKKGSRIVSDNIRKYPTEERRGEEKRGDKISGAPAATSSNGEVEKWDWETCQKFLATWKKCGADYTETETRSAWLALTANGWMWGRNPVTDPRAALERQIQTDRTKKQPLFNNGAKAKPDHSKGF